MDPGRKKIEQREAEFVATGETLMLGSVKWQVVNHARDGKTLLLHLDRLHGDRLMTHTWVGQPTDVLTVRNILTPQS